MDIYTDSHRDNRLEIVDTGRRRRFSKEVKLRIVEESYSEPGLCATTARRHGISRSQLYEWGKLARAGYPSEVGRRALMGRARIAKLFDPCVLVIETK